jgi:hypothetical protein
VEHISRDILNKGVYKKVSNWIIRRRGKNREKRNKGENEEK